MGELLKLLRGTKPDKLSFRNIKLKTSTNPCPCRHFINNTSSSSGKQAGQTDKKDYDRQKTEKNQPHQYTNMQDW